MDLLEWARPTLSRLPRIDEAEEDTLLKLPLGKSADHFTTYQLIVEKAYHHYGDHTRVDVVVFMAEGALFGALGLALLQACLRGDNLTIKLTHPKSQIREILLQGTAMTRSKELDFGLKLTDLRYWPRQPYETVEYADKQDHDHWPRFEFWPVSEATLDISGSALGLMRLVQIWLDISRPDAVHNEMNLEIPIIGIGGAAPGGAEAKFMLPESDLWPGYDLSGDA